MVLYIVLNEPIFLTKAHTKSKKKCSLDHFFYNFIIELLLIIRVVAIRSISSEICLATESVCELWNMIRLVEHRIYMLKNQNFSEFLVLSGPEDQ